MFLLETIGRPIGLRSCERLRKIGRGGDFERGEVSYEYLSSWEGKLVHCSATSGEEYASSVALELPQFRWAGCREFHESTNDAHPGLDLVFVWNEADSDEVTSCGQATTPGTLRSACFGVHESGGGSRREANQARTHCTSPLTALGEARVCNWLEVELEYSVLG